MLKCQSKEERVRVLFCCAHNRTRSLTGEHLLVPVEGYEAKSAGICKGARVEVTQKLVNWADVIFVMEYWMKEYLLMHFRVKAAKIKVLGIIDGYFYGEPELVRKIAERLERHGIDVKDAVYRFESRSFEQEFDQ